MSLLLHVNLAATAPSSGVIADIVIPVLLGLLVAVIGVATLVTSRSANRHQERQAELAREDRAATVDAAAYSRAQEIYEGALSTLRGELASTRSELASTRDEVHELRLSNDELTAETGQLRASNVRLQSEITLLRGEILRLTEQGRQNRGEVP